MIDIIIFISLMITFFFINREEDNNKNLNYIVNKKFNNNLIIITDKEKCNLENELIIDINDDVSFIKRYSMVNINDDIHIIIYCRGGNIESSDCILNILLTHKGKINIYVPYLAYSAGTMLALCADNLYMNTYSLLSPVDPQIEFDNNDDLTPVISYIKHARYKGLSNLSVNDTLRYYECKRLYDDNIRNLKRILSPKYSKQKLNVIVKELGRGYHPHAKQFNIDELNDMGFNINIGIPDNIMKIFCMFIKTVK